MALPTELSFKTDDLSTDDFAIVTPGSSVVSSWCLINDSYREQVTTDGVIECAFEAYIDPAVEVATTISDERANMELFFRRAAFTWAMEALASGLGSTHSYRVSRGAPSSASTVSRM